MCSAFGLCMKEVRSAGWNNSMSQLPTVLFIPIFVGWFDMVVFTALSISVAMFGVCFVYYVVFMFLM